MEAKPNQSDTKVIVSNTVYYQLFGPSGSDLPSGPAAYTFDAKGKFIGWTKDSGDIFEPSVVYSPTAKSEDLSVEEVRAVMQTPAN